MTSRERRRSWSFDRNRETEGFDTTKASHSHLYETKMLIRIVKPNSIAVRLDAPPWVTGFGPERLKEELMDFRQESPMHDTLSPLIDTSVVGERKAP